MASFYIIDLKPLYLSRFYLLVLLAWMLPLPVSAQQPYTLSYHHTGKQIDLQRVDSLLFQPLTGQRQLDAQDNRGPYLFRINLSDRLSAEGALLLVENEHLDTITLYRRAGNALVPVVHQGNSFPGTGRFGYPEFRLRGGTGEYYLLTTFHKEAAFVIRLDTPDRMDRWFSGVFFQLGLYYGVCLMFFVLNFFSGLYLKDRLFLYYCLFQAFIVASIVYADGFFPFITSHRWLLNNGEVLLHWGMSVTGCLFALYFLGEASRKRIIFCIGWLIASALFYSWSLVAGNYRLFLLGEAASLSLLGFLWIHAMRRFFKQVYARFFVLGYGILLLFAVDYWILRKLGVTILDLYLGQLKTGSVIEMLVLSIAIVYRMKALTAENAHYRAEIERYVHLIADMQAQSLNQAHDLFEKIRQKYGLSERELEVLHGITAGLTNQQIADRIFLSVHTVKFHTRNLFDKMEITNRTQALSRLHE